MHPKRTDRPGATRFCRPFDRSAGDGDGAGRVGQQRGAGAGLADLGHRAAHVEVDRVGPRGDHDGGGGAHHGGVLPEQLDRGRRLRPAGPHALGGVDAQ